MLKKVTFTLIAFCVFTLNAQNRWTSKKLFEQKNFIENKGQFDDKKLPNKEQIRFTANIDGVEFCFTNNGYTIIKKEKVKRTKKEIEEILVRFGLPKEEEEKEFEYKIEEKFHELKFINTSPDALLIAENRVSNYYSYSDLKSPGKKGTIIANAFTHLTYKNIYPFIDIVFEFPKDSSGIKYSIYMHPGANVENIKMVFPGNTGLKMVKQAAEINSSFGKIIDHKPVSYLLKSKTFVKSRFSLSENTLGFKVDNNTTDETIVIDPWTIVPNFSGPSDAYDIDYDNAGNVYVYGGSAAGPFVLLKFTAAGALVWTYTPTLFSLGSPGYGDFAVDRNSNNMYLIEGFNPSTGSQVVKINSSAVQLATYAGDPNFIEMWRISFSRCSNQAVIAGGGVSSPTYQTCYLDTNLTSLTNVQYVPTTNCCHDVNMLALDNYGNCYQITNRSSVGDGLFENSLVKLPLPSLLPVTYNVNTGYNLNEAGSNMYYGSVIGYVNGYNGITTSNTSVFSYDSYVLKKWSGPTGALLNYKRISYPAGGDSSLLYWGGISADDCGNLFLGDNNVVRQYDTTLTLINSYTMPGAITDIQLSNSGELYVCGIGFAASIVPTGLINCTSGGTLTLSTTSTDATCVSPGTATATVNGGSPPYNIVWNTSPPQYGSTITGVPPGTYIVTVMEASCLTQTLIDTVTIGATGGAFFSAPLITTGCAGTTNSGTITVTPSGGVLPYSYNWSTGAPTTTNTITGLAAGTYTLTITDSAGCTNTYSALVVDTATGVNYSFSGAIDCNGDTTSLSIVLSGGSAPYGVAWTSPSASGTTVYGVSAGNFNGNITDASGCVQPFAYTLTQPPLFTASTTAAYNCTVPNSGVITVTAGGGNNPYTYSWTGFPANTTNTNSSLPPGTYTVTVTDSNMCSIVLIDTIDAYSPLVINGTVTNACYDGNNGIVTVNPSGGAGGVYVYTWTGIPANTTNVVSNSGPATYTVSIVSGTCTSTATFTVSENPVVDTLNLQTSYCKGEATTNLNIGGVSQAPYQWFNLGVPVTGATQNNYTSAVNNVNNYSVNWFLGGCGYTTSGVDSTVFPYLTGTTPTNVFSPNNDASNDVFFPFVELTNSTGINYFEEYHLQIFDRWGLKVFETTSSEKGWNGVTAKGKKADDGVYFWIVNATSNCHHKEIEQKGNVHLIK
jgi:gliding motility-associated-like protein